jgi:hypothetical protein
MNVCVILPAFRGVIVSGELLKQLGCQESASLDTLEVSVRICFTVARKVFQHQKLSCNLSRLHLGLSQL